ncbi:MAG: hypothetical protein ABMA13_15900 [Chthoniobacteraceae bacterium]
MHVRHIARLAVLLRLSKTLALIAVVQILGGNWIALQSVAWVGMVIDYSKEAPLSVAIEKTFDGAHPCGLCKTVSEGRSKEQKSAKTRTLVKFEAVLARGVVIMEPASEAFEFPRLVETHSSPALAPPTPPPLV